MSAKHTPGPWEQLWLALRGIGKLVSPSDKYDLLLFEESDARRLVAAWKAVESIPTESLEAGVVREMIEALEAVVYQYDTPWDRHRYSIEKAKAVLAKVRDQSLGQSVVRVAQTDVGIANVDYGARPNCPCPELCYGEICVAPDVCHDPEIHRNPDEWRRLLEAIKRELDGEEGESS